MTKSILTFNIHLIIHNLLGYVANVGFSFRCCYLKLNPSIKHKWHYWAVWCCSLSLWLPCQFPAWSACQYRNRKRTLSLIVWGAQGLSTSDINKQAVRGLLVAKLFNFSPTCWENRKTSQVSFWFVWSGLRLSKVFALRHEWNMNHSGLWPLAASLSVCSLKKWSQGLCAA